MRAGSRPIPRELAAIYGVTIKRLNEQVKRNAPRFPEDFVFQPTAEERERLRSQFATLKTGRGRHSRFSADLAEPGNQ
jgi:ORF6N domain-containing protein